VRNVVADFEGFDIGIILVAVDCCARLNYIHVLSAAFFYARSVRALPERRRRVLRRAFAEPV
jgi:hypothetical protein